MASEHDTTPITTTDSFEASNEQAAVPDASSEPVAAPDASSEPVAAPRRTRRRASAPAAAAPTLPPSESAPDPAPDEPSEEAEPEPPRARKAAKRTRSTVAKSKTAPPAPATEADVDPVPDTIATQSPIVEVPFAAVSADDQGQTGSQAPPRGRRTRAAQGAAGFGLVFQAPDPAALIVVARPTPEQEALPNLEPASAGDPVVGDGVGDADAEGEDEDPDSPRRRRRRGGRGRRARATDAPTPTTSSSVEVDATTERTPDEAEVTTEQPPTEDDTDEGGSATHRRRRRRRGASSVETEDAPGVVTRVREARPQRSEVVGLKGSTRLEAKKQRRREGREAGRRRTVITEAEFLARRESVDRVMLVREVADRTQIAVLEDGVLVEHYVSRDANVSMAGNIYLGRVQNVLPSMEAAFVDIGKGRNAVLYAGEVNWDAAGVESGQAKRIENALSSGENVLVQVTKDPMGHKGARLTSQISLPGRYLVYVPDSSMTGISRKLPDTERARLKRILKEVLPESAGVIVRTAAEGASEEELRGDVERLTSTWEAIQAKAAAKAGKGRSGAAPVLLHGEPDLTVRVIRDIFNEDFASLVVSGGRATTEVGEYVGSVAPDLADRIQRWTSSEDLFSSYRVHEQLAKALDRKVWLPSGGSLVIDRTEAMTVIDVNTGKFVGSGGNLEETVTKNNLEAAEEIVRQLRLRDTGGIIVIDFIDMVLESNRDLVVRRLLECLGRDRTKHQVAEVTSLGLVQMTRKRVGSGLLEIFSEACDHCGGRGLVVHGEPIEKTGPSDDAERPNPNGQQPGRQRGRRARTTAEPTVPAPPTSGPTPAQIAAAAHAAALKSATSGLVGSEGSAEVSAGQDQSTDTAVVEDRANAQLGTPADDQPIHEGRASDQPYDDHPSDDRPLHDGPMNHEPAKDQPNDDHPTDDGSADDRPSDGWSSAPDLPSEQVPDDEVFEPQAQSVVTAEQAVVAAPQGAGRGRRRHGRVVAPAGPPRPLGDVADHPPVDLGQPLTSPDPADQG